MHKLIRCKRCVMDNASEPEIIFDSQGYCNFCNSALGRKNKIYFPDLEGKKRLERIIDEIKSESIGKEFDCVMGISGGLDSSYLAYLGHQYGLRVLAIHIDDGFDTDISKRNIKKLIDKTGFKMITVTPDTQQFADLTKAYMRAGVANLAAPQDNILFACLYKQVEKYKIKYFLSGLNYALESISPVNQTHNAYDIVNIFDINKKNGNADISGLDFISTIAQAAISKKFGIKRPRLLDLIDYNRKNAFEELADFCDFEYYGSKHLENILTAFVQLYWFPKKFGIDKRVYHLSSMVVSGQMTRDEAMTELEKPLYDELLMNTYIDAVKEKIGISDSEFEDIMNAETHSHNEYRTEESTLKYRIYTALRDAVIKLKK